MRGRRRPRAERTVRAGALALATMYALSGCPGGEAEPATSSGSPASTVYGQLPDVVQRVEPSVVTIFTRDGLGSGVVYKDGGILVTNAHVVGEEQAVMVGLVDGTRISGTVLATDVVTDLAVVRAERTDLPVATFRPALPRQGEFVVAIGSPLGLANTVTAGVVSGLGRQIPGSAESGPGPVDMIQTDAAISPGNSGGALLNAAGEVVGVNEAYIPPQQGAVSLGFAIPSATVIRICDQLLASGVAVHPYLGISGARLTPEIASALNLSTSEGVLVREVAPNGPAAKAGMRPGDIITALNGQPVRTPEDLLTALRQTKPGDEAQVQIVRDGQPTTLTVTIGALRAQ
jgi:S1-C subfamily serine protease